MTSSQLGNEFGFELVQSMLLALLVSMAGLSTSGSRVIFACVVGAIAAIGTNMSYWNWYGFPTIYTLGNMSIQFVAFVLAGIVIALVAARGSAKKSKAAA